MRNAKPRGQVCTLSPLEVRELEFHGTRPNCRKHEHISRRAAQELVATHYGPERLIPTKLIPTGVRQRRSVASYVGTGGRYIAIEWMPQWKKVYLAVGEIFGGPRRAAMQMRP